ncbi:MAG: penicillin-binding protein 1A [Gammaproteobacteria bacterium]|jgi:penicillin-binding protein 1A
MIKLVKIISWLFAVGSIALFAGVIFIYGVLVPGLPSIENLDDTQLQVPMRVYDKNEALLAEFGENRRIPVAFDEIPKHIIDAFVSAEDNQYWTHFGVDPLALMAAAYELLSTGKKTRGGSTITMQMVKNYFFSSEKTYTRKLNEILLALKVEREFSKEKIMELYLNKIFLGQRSYGIAAAANGYYDKPMAELTIAQAAMIAGLPKAPSNYNPIINPERALIRRNHILGRMLELSYIDEVQYALAKEEKVTAELHATRTVADAHYVAETIRAELFDLYGEDIYEIGLDVYTTIDGELQGVANRALRRNLLDYNRRHGYRGVIKNIDLSLIEEDPFEENLVSDDRIANLRKGVVLAINDKSATVLISNYEQVELLFEGGIDWANQYINVNRQGKRPTKVSDVLALGDVIWLEKRDDFWLLADVPRVQGAIVSMDTNNGAIRAMVGGFDYFQNKFNRATQAKRQPGSNFKPFIYSAALESGFTTASIINDAPVVFDDDSLESAWRPENYSGRVYGPTRLREALVKSRNLVSIRILRSIGLSFATEYAERFGFKREDMPYDLSLALGSGAFSPVEIMRGFSVFANGGYLVDPNMIIRVETGTDEVVLRKNQKIVCAACDGEAVVEDLVVEKAIEEKQSVDVVLGAQTSEDENEGEQPALVAEPVIQYAPRVITPQNAFIMRSIMREVVQRGTAVRAKALGRKDIGGKTGTTNNQVDAWFSGFNDKVVTTAWVGFDNQQTLGARETGGRAALPMWIEYMRSALNGLPENLEQQPEDMVTVKIDRETGKRADRHTANSLFEIFRVTNAPKELTTSGSGGGALGLSSVGGPESQDEIVEEIY